MNTNQLFRSLLLAALVSATTCTTSIAKPRRSVRSFAQNGFWVVETTPQNRQSLIRFYNNDSQLVYQETINRRLNIHREATQDQLNAVLEQAIDKWTASQPLKSEQKLVAMQLKMG